MAEKEREANDPIKDLVRMSMEDQARTKRDQGRAMIQGITFGYGDELEAWNRVRDDPSLNYDEELFNIRSEQKRYSDESPGAALALEFVPGIVGGGALAKGLTKVGAGFKTTAAAEGGLYGSGVGETPEGRMFGAGFGAGTGLILGATVGKLVDSAKSKVNKLTPDDIISDDGMTIRTESSTPSIKETPENIFIDKDVLDLEEWTPVENPAFRGIRFSDVSTVGELYQGLKNSLKVFYNENLSGVSDTLVREVSPFIGFRYQRGSETAMRMVAMELADFGDDLVPIIQLINENANAKGALLDYGAGYLGKTTKQARKNLFKELNTSLKTFSKDQTKTLEKYLDWSAKKNKTLNEEVFAYDITNNSQWRGNEHLHTRLNKEARQRIKKERNLDDEQLDDLFEDPAFSLRTRGRYTNTSELNTKRPNPMEYDNPIVSDMQRIFKMEKFFQIKRMANVDVQDYKEILSTLENPKKNLTPTEFMDAVKLNMINKGIPEDSAAYGRQLMVDDILGGDKAPHPIIQALSSIAYATTLAGPMSAILNVADVPLVGAKYGGKAVREGMKAIVPGSLKRVPSVDLKAAGLDSQHFGEFISLLDPTMANNANWLTKMARSTRTGADILMKGSGFAAMDQVGKKGVMRGVLSSAVEDANLGKLSGDWKFYFNEKELGILESTFKKHGDDWTKYEGRGAALAEELMFAGLGQQQLISSAGRPAGWSRNPNLRPLWALRGFVLKQQALALREVVGNINAGKPDEALKFLGRYATYGAGGYAVINEGRQFIFGDGNISAGGIVRGYGDAWASLITANTLGLNDYQFGQIKENGVLSTFVKGMMPIAVDRPVDILGRTVDVLDGNRGVNELISDTFPIAKQPARFIRNVDDLTGNSLGMFGEAAEGFLERQPRN